MKIANYKNIIHDYEQVLPYHGEDKWPETSNEFVRLTEFLDVEFTPLPNIKGELIRKEVAAIDKEIEELFTKIENFRTKKAELLSLTYEGKENETI